MEHKMKSQSPSNEDQSDKATLQYAVKLFTLKGFLVGKQYLKDLWKIRDNYKNWETPDVNQGWQSLPQKHEFPGLLVELQANVKIGLLSKWWRIHFLKIPEGRWLSRSQQLWNLFVLTLTSSMTEYIEIFLLFFQRKTFRSLTCSHTLHFSLAWPLVEELCIIKWKKITRVK